MHRLVVIALLLSACGGASKHDPAWPKSAGTVVPDDWKDDGGESIDPRVPSDVEQSETDSDNAEPPPATSAPVATAVGTAATGGDSYGGATYGTVTVSGPPPSAP